MIEPLKDNKGTGAERSFGVVVADGSGSPSEEAVSCYMQKTSETSAKCQLLHGMDFMLALSPLYY